jgi:hypothetical protein
MADIAKTEAALISELRGLIEQARQHVAQTANSTLTLLHWRLGERIRREVLQGERARVWRADFADTVAPIGP